MKLKSFRVSGSIMCVMQTLTPRTTLAKAAFAEGIRLSAIATDMRPVASLGVEYRLGYGPFGNRRYTPDVGSEGVTVM